MIRLWILAALLAVALAFAAGRWQVGLIALGMGLFIESDHDRVHHPGRGMSHMGFQIGGLVLATLSALALRYL